MKRIITLAIAALLVLGTTAKASFLAFYTFNTANVYNYTLRFSVDELGEVLRNGDRITLYDVAFPQDITGVTSPTSPAGVITISQQLTGITPTLLAGASGISDSPLLQNITFTYTGSTLTSPQDFTLAKVTMIPSYVVLRVGTMSGSTGMNFNIIPPVGFQDNSSLRPVLLPALFGGTPEPASLTMFGLAATALLIRRRKA